MSHNNYAPVNFSPPVQEEVLEPGYSFFARKKSLLRKASSFLARNIALKRYRFTFAQPLVSFTFDDIPVSAFKIAAPLLEEAGHKGTFYIATALCGTYSSGAYKATLADIQQLAQHGHEIALHTHEHMPIFVYNQQGFAADMGMNHALLQAIAPQVTRNFAAPYGVLSLWHKINMRHKLRSIRSILQGINVGNIDPFCLKILNLDAEALSDAQIMAYLHQAKAQNAWVIFMSHNVDAQQGHITTSVARLKMLLKTTETLGFQNMTVEAALNKIGVPLAQKEFSLA